MRSGQRWRWELPVWELHFRGVTGSEQDQSKEEKTSLRCTVVSPGKGCRYFT